MAIDSISGTSGSAATSGSQTNQTTATQSSGLDALANENTFLQLFIAQLKNQDPLSPQDGTQFVAQLAQFSNLEQTLGMHSDITAIRTDLEKYFGTATSGAATGTGASTGSADSTKG